jgi:hypothetical protein
VSNHHLYTKMAELRMGYYVGLNKYLHTIGQVDRPKCDVYNEPDESQYTVRQVSSVILDSPIIVTHIYY